MVHPAKHCGQESNLSQVNICKGQDDPWGQRENFKAAYTECLSPKQKSGPPLSGSKASNAYLQRSARTGKAWVCILLEYSPRCRQLPNTLSLVVSDGYLVKIEISQNAIVISKFPSTSYERSLPSLNLDLAADKNSKNFLTFDQRFSLAPGNRVCHVSYFGKSDITLKSNHTSACGAAADPAAGRAVQPGSPFAQPPGSPWHQCRHIHSPELSEAGTSTVHRHFAADRHKIQCYWCRMGSPHYSQIHSCEQPKWQLLVGWQSPSLTEYNERLLKITE